MSGITGLINFDGRPVKTQVITAMTDTLIHRGPGGEEFFVNCSLPDSGQAWKHISGTGNVGLGCRCLNISGLVSSSQHMSNAEGTVWITFDGKIYNYADIRKKLEELGYVFKTNCDTEVIIYAYETWGDDCVNHLRGAFAFAIWDERKKKLFLGRDRLGEKPLYYYWDGKRLVFGSELKAILAYSDIPRELDIQAICDYFCLLYIPAPRSIYKNIFKLPAGYVLSCDTNDGPRLRQYWDIKFQPQEGISEEKWCELLTEKLTEAVKIRMSGDVRPGAFLSGGVDSSAVVAIMSGLSDYSVKTSSIGFEEQKFNELPYARIMAQKYKTDHRESVIRADAVSILEKLVWHYDEPFGDSSAIPTYYASQLIRERTPVALSGDGGDEIFAGYRRHYFDFLENQLRGMMPAFFRHSIISLLANIYPKADWLPQIFRAKTLLTNLSLEPVAGYFNSVSYFGKQKNLVLSLDLRNELKGYSPLETFEQYGKNSGTNDPLARIQYIDIKTNLVDDGLTKVDRASMANSLEVRSPLLDHEFVELAARIPSRMKLCGKEGKYIFKKLLKPLVPNEILYRQKMGFSMPVKDWLKNDLKSTFEENVFNSRADIYFDQSIIRKLWERHQSGVNDFSAELWAILFFVRWLELVRTDSKIFPI